MISIKSVTPLRSPSPDNKYRVAPRGERSEAILRQRLRHVTANLINSAGIEGEKKKIENNKPDIIGGQLEAIERFEKAFASGMTEVARTFLNRLSRASAHSLSDKRPRDRINALGRAFSR